jgi:hypothetical protein
VGELRIGDWGKRASPLDLCCPAPRKRTEEDRRPRAPGCARRRAACGASLWTIATGQEKPPRGEYPPSPPCLSTPFPGPSASPPPLLFLFGPYSRHPRRTTRSVDAHVRAARTWVRAALPHASSRVTRAQSRRGRKAPLFEQPARRAYVFCPRRAPRCAPRVCARGRSREATQSRGGTGDAAPPSPPAWTSSFLAFCVCPCPGRHHSRDDVPQPVAPDRRRAVSQASRGDVRTCQV